ncbi:hypothetical protein BASA50_005978 [Batrachochytrium salamandrivorans]|uniref:Rab-GAP TBC domain-containing protein n=1 Tax=Batrachochytrium salamandrivorans TaxID=1357716 RepID=A0ABQ8FCE3_9FUNG|nr:hypothetical protein BASA50_005978 [Batrachochytrium salamandrivorans]
MALPWRTVLRVWDMFFCDGPKALLRVGMGILSAKKSYLIKQCPTSSDAIGYLLQVPREFDDADALLKICLRIKIKHDDMGKFRERAKRIHASLDEKLNTISQTNHLSDDNAYPHALLACMDALWTARKAIQIGILVDTHPFSVDHCILCDQQLLSTSIAHLVVECEQVTGHRIQSGLVPAIQKSRLRLLGRALDPGVENVYTWLRGGVLNGEADLDQRWLDGTVEHESMGTRHDNRALAARLADFLQVAYRQYQSTLWKYHRDRIVEVG